MTGVCYVRPIRTIWVAAGTAEANMYDPKSGENVSVLPLEKRLLLLIYIKCVVHIITLLTEIHLRKCCHFSIVVMYM